MYGRRAIATGLLLLSGCQQKQAAAPAHSINDSMAQVMEPTAQAIWDMMSKAYNDKGDALDSTKLSDADWKVIEESSAKMLARAQEMADAPKQMVVAPNEVIMGSQAVGEKSPAGADWEAVGPETVQKRIDADPGKFAEKARVLVDSADKMHRAALARDVVLLYKTGSQLDEVCDGCHEPFWGTDEPPPYPQ
jgi:hypothetical protein